MNASEKIKEMLTENTGKSFLDSGDHYGRNYEQNQGIDFDSMPSVVVDTSYLNKGDTSKDITYSINVYHYLKNQLAFDDVSNEFNEFIKGIRDHANENPEYEYPHWVQEVMESISNHYEIETSGTITNTYNYDSNLSQVILYQTFEYEDEFYVCLQIHGGCDVRGGYTDAVIFKLDNDYWYDNGYMNPEDVYGCIDGINVSNTYDGCYISTDDNQYSEGVALKFDDDGKCVSEIELNHM